MAVSNFIVRMSGTVAYTDNSHGSFEASASWKGELGGVIATHNSPDSQANFSQLAADKASGLSALLAVLPGTITLTPPTAAPDKTVSSFVMEISGLVSYNDKTPNGVFITQWVDGVVDLFPADAAKHWAALAGDSGANTFLTQVFEALTGVGNASVA
jgi:hypothetical protein